MHSPIMSVAQGPASSVARQERAQLLLAVLGGVDVVVDAVAVVVAQVLVGAALQQQLGHLDVGELARKVELLDVAVGVS